MSLLGLWCYVSITWSGGLVDGSPPWMTLLRLVSTPVYSPCSLSHTLAPCKTFSKSDLFWSGSMFYQSDRSPIYWLLFDKRGWVLTVQYQTIRYYFQSYACSELRKWENFERRDLTVRRTQCAATWALGAQPTLGAKTFLPENECMKN